MTEYVNQLGDLRQSTISARVMGSRVGTNGFLGMLKSLDVLHQGTSITMRPPMKFISRATRNEAGFFIPIATPKQAEKTLIAINQTQGIQIVSGSTVATGADEFSIVSVNKDLSVTLDKALPAVSDSTGIIVAFYGKQQLELFTYQPTAVANTYNINALIGTEPDYINKFWTFKLATITVIPTFVQKPVDYVLTEKLNYFFTGSAGKAYSISDAGVFAELAIVYQAEVATTYRNFLVLGATENNKLVLRFSRQETFTIDNSTPRQILADGYGSRFFWMKSSSKGLFFATDSGVFLAEFNNSASLTTITNIIIYDERTSIPVRPFRFNGYLFFAGSDADNILYTWYEFYSSDLSVKTLNTKTGILSGEVITKMDLVYFHANPVALVLTKSGKLFTVHLGMERENVLLSSYSQWLVNYSVDDFIIYRNEFAADEVIFSLNINGYSVFTSIKAMNEPQFELDNQQPFLDFYMVYNIGNTFHDKTTLHCNFNNNSGEILADTDFFRADMVGAVIKNDFCNLMIQNVESARRALATRLALTGSRTANNFVLAADDYALASSTVQGLNHLQILKNPIAVVNKQTYALNASGVRGEFSLGTLADVAICGFSYRMEIVTIPPCTELNSLDVSYNISVRIQHIGYQLPDLSVSDGNVVASEGIETKPANLNLRYDDGEIFIKIFDAAVPTSRTSGPLVRISARSPYPPYISAIAIGFNKEEG